MGALLGKPSQANIPVVFVVCYIAGAVIAVCAVRRRGLFGPMVMPPLVLAVTVPGVILLTSGSQGDDMLAKALNIGSPLINSFPMMAITTGITLLIGFVRIFRERDPDAPKKGKAVRRPDEDDEQPRPSRPRPPRPVRPPRRRRGSPCRLRPPSSWLRRNPRSGCRWAWPPPRGRRSSRARGRPSAKAARPSRTAARAPRQGNTPGSAERTDGGRAPPAPPAATSA
ncbi:DUF6542 domain-containing protein, partial [Amycolatopsis solani]|uniref:DUF6542 domain-containing protein n=1 Tax=Amycolatopsis solani TaxID=3028615 RepID=UPI003F68BF3E